MGKKQNQYILLHYLHRDDGNYKEHETRLFTNRNNLSEELVIKSLKENSLDQDGAFYPLEVGLSAIGSENDWHEVVMVEAVICTDPEETVDITELVRRFKRMKQRHSRSSAKKSVIPSISSLVSEVLSVLHQLWTALYSYRGKVVQVAIHLDDFHTIEETLEMDSESSAFDPEIRRSLKRGLKRMKEVNINPIFDLRKKLMRVEKESK
jgi:hypothetical protein